jgi:hypothetical protein
MKLEFSKQNFEKSSNIKFNENPSSGSKAVACGQTDGLTDRQDKANSRFSSLKSDTPTYLQKRSRVCMLYYLNGVYCDVSYIKGTVNWNLPDRSGVLNCFMWHFLQVIRKIKIRPCTEVYEIAIIHGRKEKGEGCINDYIFKPVRWGLVKTQNISIVFHHTISVQKMLINTTYIPVHLRKRHLVTGGLLSSWKPWVP